MFSVIQALVIQTSSVSMEVEQCVGCKALRLRGGWSPPVVRLHAWPLVAPMAAARLSRRELASWAACGAGAALAPRAAHAFAPPVGNVELLLPLLRCREIVAEQREAFAAVTLTLTLTLTAHRSPLTAHHSPFTLTLTLALALALTLTLPLTFHPEQVRPRLARPASIRTSDARRTAGRRRRRRRRPRQRRG